MNDGNKIATDTVETSTAEADALHLADLMDEFEGEGFVFLADDTRTIVNRVLKAAGKTPRSVEQRAQATAAVTSHAPKMCVTCGEFPAEFGNICIACDCDEHGEVKEAEQARINLRASAARRLAGNKDDLPPAPPAVVEPDAEDPQWVGRRRDGLTEESRANAVRVVAEVLDKTTPTGSGS